MNTASGNVDVDDEVTRNVANQSSLENGGAKSFLFRIDCLVNIQRVDDNPEAPTVFLTFTKILGACMRFNYDMYRDDNLLFCMCENWKTFQLH